MHFLDGFTQRLRAWPAAAVRAGALAVMTAGLAACGGQGGSGLEPLSAPAQPQAAANTIGTGKTRIGLILPLSAGGGAAGVAASLRNAADLAIQEFNQPDIQLLVRDDRGTAEGAAAAAREVLGEQAQLIIGPLFAPSVRAVSGVAQPAGKPVIAFSTDSTVAGRGTYLLSFLPESDVSRVIGYAASRGKKSFSALIPQTAYGNVVAAAFQQAVASHGGRIVSLERYTPQTLAQAVRNVAQGAAGIDALFVPESGEGMPAVAQALAANRIDTRRVQLLGTGAWNDPRIFRLPQLAGGWFAAPDSAGFNGFAARYKAKFGADPSRIATLAYDAVALSAALVRTRGSQAFSEATLTNPSGFAGQDGVFRFLNNGLNERGLAVQQIGNGTASIISPAPRTFESRS